MCALNTSRSTGVVFLVCVCGGGVFKCKKQMSNLLNMAWEQCLMMRSDWLHHFPVLQGLRFEVVPSWFKETLEKSSFTAPYEYAVETAKQKALEVANRMHVVSYYCYNELFLFRWCMLLWLNLLALLKWSLRCFFSPLKANGCFPVICERWCLEIA